jgi:antitoxin ChpS
MLAIPRPVLDELQIAIDALVDLSIDGGRLVVEPKRKPRYSLDELLAQCDSKAPRRRGEKNWVDGAPVGRELI